MPNSGKFIFSKVVFVIGDFPKINQTQIALLRIDCFTGHILDSNYVKWQSNCKDKEAYSVFNSLDEAIDYIELQKYDYPNAEYSIYNQAQELIYRYYPKEPSNLPEHNLDTKFSVWTTENEVYVTFNTFDEGVSYIELIRPKYPNSEFLLRDYSQGILYTYKKKGKRFFNLFYHLQFFIKHRLIGYIQH